MRTRGLLYPKSFFIVIIIIFIIIIVNILHVLFWGGSGAKNLHTINWCSSAINSILSIYINCSF